MIVAGLCSISRISDPWPQFSSNDTIEQGTAISITKTPLIPVSTEFLVVVACAKTYRGPILNGLATRLVHQAKHHTNEQNYLAIKNLCFSGP